MKKVMLLTVLCVILFPNLIYAQIPEKLGVVSIEVLPENPVVGDEINLIYKNVLYGYNLELLDTTINIFSDQIEVKFVYRPGPGGWYSYSIDTIPLGSLPYGTYSVESYVKNIYDSTTYEKKDDFEFTFSVGTLAVTDYTTNDNVAIFPNPFNSEIKINTTLNIETIEVYSIDGRKIELEQNYVNTSRPINLSNLKDGIYLILVTDKKGYRYAKKIVKQNVY